MAAFSSLPAALLSGGLNPFQAAWMPLFGSVVADSWAAPSGPKAPASRPATPAPAPSGTGTPPAQSPERPAQEPSGEGTQPSPPAPPPSPSPPPAPAPAAPKEDEAEDRSQGRASLVTTSLRGVLTPRPGGLKRKTLLGE